MASFKPVTSSEYLAQKGEVTLDQEGGVHIEPTPGVVVKAWMKPTKEKLFINIVSHPIIDEPDEKELVELGEENQGALRIPMSLGNIREDFDKSKETLK